MEFSAALSPSPHPPNTQQLPQPRRPRPAPQAAPTLRRSGLHTLTFAALSPVTVAYRMGAKYPFFEKFRVPSGVTRSGVTRSGQEEGRAGQGLSTQEELTQRVAYVQERLQGFQYDIEKDHIEAVFYYPLDYALYSIYFPYQKMSEEHPEVCGLFLTFLTLAGKLGLSFWFESFCTDSIMWSIEDDPEGFFGEGETEKGEQVVREAKSMQDAARKVRIKRPDTLRRKLVQCATADEREAAFIATLLKWVDFLKQEDNINNYALRDGYQEGDEDYEEILPDARFMVLPCWGEHAEQWWNESLHQGEWLDIATRFTLDETLLFPAIPTFPMQLGYMVEEIVAAIVKLIPDNDD